MNTTFSASPDAPKEARNALEALAGEIDAQPLEDLRLIVSELITNSVRHAGIAAGEAIELEVGMSDHTIRGQVSDGGFGFEPASFGGAPDRTSGWGLWLVDALADRWGMSAGDGAIVWFELSTRVGADESGASA